MADYVIYRSGANTIAKNTSTGSDEFTNASAASVINSCLSALNTAGAGGTIYIKRGNYTISAAIPLYNNIQIVGESRDSTILTNAHSGNLMERTGSTVSNFTIKNITLKSTGGSVGRPIYFAGATYTVLQGCRFQYSSPPTTSVIMVWYDDVNGTTQNYYNKITNNIFDGSANGQDMLGVGSMDWSVISGNNFLGYTQNGQAIGVAGTKYATFANNTFRDTFNIVGLEGNGPSDVNPSQGNTIIGNTGYNSGRIKLSEIGTNNKSIFNVVVGNQMVYGNAGIEAGNSYGDIIADNVIARTTTLGIEGTFTRCIIKNNLLIDTNYNNSQVTLNAILYRRGGIVLRNNTTNMPDPDGTIVQGNKIVRTPATWIHEPDGTTKSGFNGGILIDTNYDKTSTVDNNIENANTNTYVNHGTNTINRNNDII